MKKHVASDNEPLCYFYTYFHYSEGEKKSYFSSFGKLESWLTSYNSVNSVLGFWFGSDFFVWAMLFK